METSQNLDDDYFKKYYQNISVFTNILIFNHFYFCGIFYFQLKGIMMRCCHGISSVYIVFCVSLIFHNLIFFSETMEPNKTKHEHDEWDVPFQLLTDSLAFSPKCPLFIKILIPFNVKYYKIMTQKKLKFI